MTKQAASHNYHLTFQDKCNDDLRPEIFSRAHFEKYTYRDENLEREILGIYNEQIHNILQKLKDISLYKNIKIDLHSIKGSSLSIGAFRIATIAALMEKFFDEGDKRDWEDLHNELEHAITEFTFLINRLYP